MKTVLLSLLASASFAFAGPELIVNGDFSSALDGWRLDRLQNAEGTLDITTENGKSTAAVHVPAPAEKRYFVQLVQKGIKLDADKTYVFRMRARSVPAASIVVKVLENQQPQQMVELWAEDHIALGDDWQEYRYEFQPKNSTDNAYLVISGLAAQAGDYGFGDVSLTVRD